MGIKEPEIRFVTPGGERMVILPEEVFDKLVEDAEDAEDAVIVAAWNSGAPEETWPMDVVEKLMAGANPIRVYRRHRGLSQTGVAAATGLSNAYLSEIETGKQEGSLDARRRIAAVLNVTLDDLEPWVAPPPPNKA